MPSLLQEIKRDTELILSRDSIVLDSVAATEHYTKSTEGFERRLFGAIKVTHHNDIPQILAFANRSSANIVLYPISTGNNWGYGSALPNLDTANDSNNEEILRPVIVDLSALRQISMVNPKLGIVRVEPGVTQKQLHEYLEQAQLNFMVPVTGAGNHCSILGNALERGYGITPRQDHFAALTDLKAYLPDGTHYQSPIRELLASHQNIRGKDEEHLDWVNHSYKWNVGPYLDGLFTQSAFGIVHECTIRLKKRPDAFDSFYVSYYQKNALKTAIKHINTILEEFEGIVGSINLMDKRRVIAMVSSNPNLSSCHALDDAQVNQIAEDEDIPSWTIAGTIYGNKKVCKAVKQEITGRFKDADRIVFSSSMLVRIATRINQAEMLQPLVKAIRKVKTIDQQFERLNTLRNGIEIMQGKPNEVAKKLAYWRNKETSFAQSVNKSPSEDGCGLLWYAPLVPMEAQHISAFIEHVRGTCLKHDIDPMITFTNLSHDLIDSTIPILFDAKSIEARKAAQNCLTELVNKGLVQGYVPYRLNIEQQQAFMTQDLSVHRIMTNIYEKLDENGILQRGRYGK